MNKRPVILRTFIALVVILVFLVSVHPLAPRDFYDTFKAALQAEGDSQAQKLIAEAKKRQAADSSLHPSQALLQSADAEGVELKELVRGKDLQVNQDVIGLIRKKSGSSIRFGLDLNGGVEFMLELAPDQEFIERVKAATKDDADAAVKFKERMETEFSRYRDIAIETLRSRMEAQKIFEAEISPAGGNYISLKAPLVSKDEKLKLLDLIKMSAKLRFHLVAEDNASLVKQYLDDPENFVPPIGYQMMETRETQKPGKAQQQIYFVQRRWKMDGRNIIDAFPSQDQFGQRKIILRFDTTGARRFGEVTSRNVGKMLAVVLDNKLYCAPVINQAIMGGSAEISGNFSNEEAVNISNALVSGSLPFQIKVVGIFDTDPTLGADNVKNGIYAGILALLVVALFMCCYYRRAGVVATVALGINLILVLGALAAFDATLTLPGIAGIILTIGMAVDANVLIFERIREELNKKKGLMSAIDIGYSKAFTTILDANLTTLFTALILMKVGTGPVKGFAVTLSIGIMTSMFTALFLTRLMFDYFDRMFKYRDMKMFHLLSSPAYDFLGKRRIAFVVSIVLMVCSLTICAIKGRNILGVDFTGGTRITFDYKEHVPVSELENALKNFDAKITYKSSMAQTDNRKLEILIRKNIAIEGDDEQATSPKEDIRKLLVGNFPQMALSGGQETSLGGLVGWEFSKSAMLAIFLSFIGIVIYIWVRFELAYGIAAIIALLHDVTIATGIFVALNYFGFSSEISLPVIAALLTIIGYSLNDTIVVFDRIRENLGIIKDKNYTQVINISINDTLSRTLLTSVTTLAVLIVLLIFGGIAIRDFVLVMLLGVVVGTYSSVFIASPVVAIWHRKIRHREESKDRN